MSCARRVPVAGPASCRSGSAASTIEWCCCNCEYLGALPTLVGQVFFAIEFMQLARPALREFEPALQRLLEALLRRQRLALRVASIARWWRAALRSMMPRWRAMLRGLPSPPVPTVVKPTLSLPTVSQVGPGGHAAEREGQVGVAEAHEAALRRGDGRHGDAVVAGAHRPGGRVQVDVEVVGAGCRRAEGQAQRVGVGR